MISCCCSLFLRLLLCSCATGDNDGQCYASVPQVCGNGECGRRGQISGIASKCTPSAYGQDAKHGGLGIDEYNEDSECLSGYCYQNPYNKAEAWPWCQYGPLENLNGRVWGVMECDPDGDGLLPSDECMDNGYCWQTAASQWPICNPTPKTCQWAGLRCKSNSDCCGSALSPTGYCEHTIVSRGNKDSTYIGGASWETSGTGDKLCHAYKPGCAIASAACETSADCCDHDYNVAYESQRERVSNPGACQENMFGEKTCVPVFPDDVA